MSKRLSLSSPEKTVELGETLANTFYPNLVVALYGDLGAGKTTFVQGVLKGLQIQDRAQSPTFSLLHIYDGPLPVFHFDLYRLKGAQEFVDLGFEEYFDAGGVCIIEWAKRIESLLPKTHLRIDLQTNGLGRTVEIWR